MNLDKLTLDELTALSNQPFKCDFLDRCEFDKHDGCYNHFHCMCEHYDVYYDNGPKKTERFK